MATNLAGQDPLATPPRRILSKLRIMLAIGLLTLLVVCIVFSWATRDAMANLPLTKGPHRSAGLLEGQNAPVDLSPWQTAQSLAALAVTAEEQEYAHEAERLADHEVDQAFASALRQVSTQHHSLKGEALKLSQKVDQLQQLVKGDQTHLQRLTQKTGAPATSSRNRAVTAILADDLDVAKAQLDLDSDELTDAQQDLARAVGDDRNRIEQELAAHKLAVNKNNGGAAKESQVAVVTAQRQGSLARRLNVWFDERGRYQSIQEAVREAQADSAALVTQHDQLESQVNAASAPGVNSPSEPINNGAVALEAGKAGIIASLNNRAAQRQLLSIYDDRIQTEQQLAAVYGKWSAQVLLQHRIVLHLMMQSFALIASILLGVILFDALVGHFLDQPTRDRRSMHTLQTILKLAIQVVGVVLILLVIFGTPNQMPTIIGLTTAGITVALQDFILAFVGWFILMGKNGIGVGDWVEINGIGGEVIETGLLRTVLLETGNWTDKGHPTGRRITFMNSFAVKGQYFNFSTSSQWMWDEITLTVPAGEDTYRMIELIHKAVIKETESDARFAEQEWKRVTRQNTLGHFAADSAVDMRPGVYGIDVTVRYVTRASERFQVRKRLYHCIIDLLRKQTTLKSPLDQPQVPLTA